MKYLKNFENNNENLNDIIFNEDRDRNIETLNKINIAINNGADINIQDIDGDTPLINSIRKNYLNISKYLIVVGADINIRNKAGDTALFINTIYDIPLFDYLIDNGADINIPDNNGESILMACIKGNKLKLAKKCIDCNANVNQQTINDKNTALTLIANKFIKAENKSLLYDLIDVGADWNSKNSNNKDFLDMLSQGVKDDIIKKYPEKYKEYLIKKQADKFNI